MSFECGYCNLKLNKKYNLIRHIKNIHQDKLQGNSNSELEIININFHSMQEFYNWKDNEEVNSSTRYVQHRGIRWNNNKSVGSKTFYCHRSGRFVSKSTGKRSLKITGSYKIEQNCPSFIKVTIRDDNCVQVSYCKTHLGHQHEIKYLPIPANIQNTIADKIKSGVPSNVVIDQLHDDFDNNIVKKYIITRKDVYNISAKFGLLHKYKRHNVDALSVDLQFVKDEPSQSAGSVYDKENESEITEDKANIIKNTNTVVPEQPNSTPLRPRPTIPKTTIFGNPPELQEAKNQMKEELKMLKNIITKRANEKEDDEYDLFGKMLAKKLRKLPEHEREVFMYEIGGMYIKKLHNINSISTYSNTLSTESFDPPIHH